MMSAMGNKSHVDFVVLFGNIEYQFTAIINEHGIEILFACFAKNSDEAKEKAANAYPGCKIADVAITGSTL